MFCIGLIIALCALGLTDSASVYASKHHAHVEPSAPSPVSTPLESEMLERKKRCNDCQPIGFIFIGEFHTHKSKREDIDTINPLPEDSMTAYISTRKDIVLSAIEDVLNSPDEEITAKSSEQSLNNTITSISQGQDNNGNNTERLKRQPCCGQLGGKTENCCTKVNKNGGNCCGDRGDLSQQLTDTTRTVPSTGNVRLELRLNNSSSNENSKNRTEQDVNDPSEPLGQGGRSGMKSAHNCSLLMDFKNITEIDFPDDLLAVICIDNYDKFGFCGPIAEVPFDCDGFDPILEKHLCCVEKFIDAFITSFEKLLDFGSELDILGKSQKFVSIYPESNSPEEE